jgi:hypothetical protein
MEIEHGGTAINAVTLDMDEDGVFLRAVGPSLEDLARRAIYTVTLHDFYSRISPSGPQLKLFYGWLS